MPYPIVLLLAIALFVLRRMLTSVRKTTPGDVGAILGHLGTDLEPHLQARARTNRNLESALGVTSTFVSEDAGAHTEFIGMMVGFLSGAGTRWGRLVKVTESGVTQFLPQTTCDLAGFIRCVTFHVWVLGILNPDDPANRQLLSEGHLTVEQLTNAFFKFSETSASVSPDQIRGALRQWIADDNPVNLVFPMYEKLWRLVAATVLCTRKFPVSQNPLLDFCENPTERQFTTASRDGPNVEDIMNEVLRLHPPVQEISRQYGLARWLRGRVQVADIKAVQKFHEDGQVIDEPDGFKLERWTSGKKPVMFAFGKGALECPGRPWVPVLAAFIASKVVESVDGVAFELVDHNVETANYIWDGWSIRRSAGA